MKASIEVLMLKASLTVESGSSTYLVVSIKNNVSNPDIDEAEAPAKGLLWKLKVNLNLS